MDPSPSDAEISAWIDKGLDTVEHFLSASTQSVRSLGKSTIKPGNTEELVAAAEKVAANTAKGILSGVRGTNPDPATRPKEKQKGSPVKMQHQEQESVYEEVIPTESAPLIPKTTPKKPPRNKEKVMSMMALSPPDESLDETHEAVFKRGSTSTTWPRRHRTGGHRREIAISWATGTPRVTEWCNPICHPISQFTYRGTCRCGCCPDVCSLCERDYALLADIRDPDCES
ncbi:V protein [Tioman virus]|uniref:V protein n=1 Tax=Tioman virus TaxID=162013 RepID=Q91NG9_9MONO|nr:V protein [Tioman virus]AAK63200.1 V protein [Tioman virus]AOO85399.2 V protein [Tioman virus]